MRWIREHKIIAGLLALLLVLILIFLLSLGDRQNNSVTGSINKAMSYVSGPFTAVTRTVRDTVSGIFSYKSLQAQVEELTAEKEELERELAQSALKKSELEELRELSGLLNYDYTEEDSYYEEFHILPELYDTLGDSCLLKLRDIMYLSLSLLPPPV